MKGVFILVDALGWELVRDRGFATDILPHQQEVETIFGFSSAAIPSILTGLLPKGHGHWNLFAYDPPNSPFWFAKPLRFLPNAIANNRIVRKVVSLVGRKLSRTRGYFQTYGVPTQILPLFDVCEKEDLYSPGGLHPSTSIFDLLVDKGVAYRSYSYHELNDTEIIRKACIDIEQRAAEFYFVYLCELDGFLHDNIHEAQSVEDELRKYENAVRRIYKAAVEVDSSVPVYVFSDHGMTKVTETFDLMGVVDGLGWQVPSDYLVLYDSTMARFWFFNDRARETIMDSLRNLPCGRWITEVDAKSFGIDFDDNRYGDGIFLMNDGVLMHPSHMGRTPWRGMHGFHPLAPSSSASLLARQAPKTKVRHVADLFALMREEGDLR